jgi:hypothetical protein
MSALAAGGDPRLAPDSSQKRGIDDSGAARWARGPYRSDQPRWTCLKAGVRRDNTTGGSEAAIAEHRRQCPIWTLATAVDEFGTGGNLSPAHGRRIVEPTESSPDHQGGPRLSALLVNRSNETEANLMPHSSARCAQPADLRRVGPASSVSIKPRGSKTDGSIPVDRHRTVRLGALPNARIAPGARSGFRAILGPCEGRRARSPPKAVKITSVQTSFYQLILQGKDHFKSTNLLT